MQMNTLNFFALHIIIKTLISDHGLQQRAPPPPSPHTPPPASPRARGATGVCVRRPAAVSAAVEDRERERREKREDGEDDAWDPHEKHGKIYITKK
jgi:hypothetical protein